MKTEVKMPFEVKMIFLLSTYSDFRVFGESKNFKICDAIIDIAIHHKLHF